MTMVMPLSGSGDQFHRFSTSVGFKPAIIVEKQHLGRWPGSRYLHPFLVDQVKLPARVSQLRQSDKIEDCFSFSSSLVPRCGFRRSKQGSQQNILENAHLGKRTGEMSAPACGRSHSASHR